MVPTRDIDSEKMHGVLRETGGLENGLNGLDGTDIVLMR
jgi:hypothetical protein